MALNFFEKSKKKKEAKEKQKHERKFSYANYPELKKIKAREKYVFHSDYFQIDNYYAEILMFRHNSGSEDNYPAFWGVNAIPMGLPAGATTITFNQVQRMSKSWVTNNQPRAEKIKSKNQQAQTETGTALNQIKAVRANHDLREIANQILNGASYLNVKSRMLVKAPTLATLEDCITKIKNAFNQNFGTLTVAPYNGRQKQDLYNLLGYNNAKYGKGFYFTSTAYAGEYNLVTNGLEDPNGTYVGSMYGDVNSSAVLFDADNFRKRAVVATDQFNMIGKERVHLSDMWGMKIAQMALLNNHRVVHLVLNSETNLDDLGPKLESLTSTIDMNQGDLNMFEMFGELDKNGQQKDSNPIFAQQMNKLKLMAEQAYQVNDHDKSIIENKLEKIATKFYIQQRMWFPNAPNHKDQLRIYGLRHDDVPKLDTFTTYLDTEYQHQLVSPVKNQDEMHAIEILQGTFNNLLSSNGDLFNTYTTSSFDGTRSGRRVVYDFGKLRPRGHGVAMAQLVNVLAYAVSNLGDGDIVIIHGADLIDEGVRSYCTDYFNQLIDRGGRVVFLYNNVRNMLADEKFNLFDEADYTVLGNMSPNMVRDYQKLLGQTVPDSLSQLITEAHEPALNFIRRKKTNVVFEVQIPLWPNNIDYGIKERRHY